MVKLVEELPAPLFDIDKAKPKEVFVGLHADYGSATAFIIVVFLTSSLHDEDDGDIYYISILAGGPPGKLFNCDKKTFSRKFIPLENYVFMFPEHEEKMIPRVTIATIQGLIDNEAISANGFLKK